MGPYCLELLLDSGCVAQVHFYSCGVGIQAVEPVGIRALTYLGKDLCPLFFKGLDQVSADKTIGTGHQYSFLAKGIVHVSVLSNLKSCCLSVSRSLSICEVCRCLIL